MELKKQERTQEINSGVGGGCEKIKILYILIGFLFLDEFTLNILIITDPIIFRRGEGGDPLSVPPLLKNTNGSLIYTFVWRFDRDKMSVT